jgi:hypothetical protein
MSVQSVTVANQAQIHHRDLLRIRESTKQCKLGLLIKIHLCSMYQLYY